jgi:hypothetical protein
MLEEISTMRSKKSKATMLRKNTSPIEITITKFGLWLYIHDQEFFLSFADYPLFKNAPLNAIFNIELHHKEHLYWPELDVDLSVTILKNPHHFPLIAH